ncbi:hypothetical protein KWI08_09145 [Morganella morganii]|uniref:hypothetical protein n=1 Tax=Morganella morganii TaxID=582 RepID=UPI0021D3E683|nr:hypothetical protein [Morganella morganii]MCU6274059.1 hypothetical protein [Morganella morganii]
MLQRSQIAHSKKMVSIPDNTGMCKYRHNTLAEYCYPQTEYRHLSQHQVSGSLTDYKKPTLSAIFVIFYAIDYVDAFISALI